MFYISNKKHAFIFITLIKIKRSIKDIKGYFKIFVTLMPFSTFGIDKTIKSDWNNIFCYYNSDFYKCNSVSLESR